MKINSIDKYRIQPSMQAGLYFSKTSNVIFNKNANFLSMFKWSNSSNRSRTI